MRMLRTGINLQLLEHFVPEGALGQHAADGLLERELALVGQQVAVLGFLQSARSRSPKMFRPSIRPPSSRRSSPKSTPSSQTLRAHNRKKIPAHPYWKGRKFFALKAR